ncbi:hypothetical protein Zmor_022175 [Zophobas morio]|uniref:Nuclear nucleic acid-binding protein C1D n=1 Tax=Zophobas morio TaxID=2755281 RepID=A0AA38I0R1_9CUCU|nr:hypothetical protein Zmor_022175 [Zophobas morio]
MESDIDFGDLRDDKLIQQKLTNFHNSVQKIGKIVELSSNPDLYEKLTTKEKVDFDLFMAYTLNTLFWLYMKTKGEDPNKSEIKNQLNRVKEYMVKAKDANDKAHRPRVNQAAAARFIKHGIHYKDGDEPEEPPVKKMKLSD